MRVFHDPAVDGSMPPRARTFLAALGLGAAPFMALGCFCCCVGFPTGRSRSVTPVRTVASAQVEAAPAVQASDGRPD